MRTNRLLRRVVRPTSIQAAPPRLPCAAMLFAWLVLGLCLDVPNTLAQGGPPMLTDDPGTPGDGHWEINIAALDEHNRDANTHELPLLDVNYGIGERIQLKVEIPWLMQNTRGHDGVGDGLAGVKWRFYDATSEQDKDALQISMYPQAEFESPLSRTSHPGLTENSLSYLVPIEIERGFGGFDLTAEFGRWFRPDHRDDSWIGGVVLGHEIDKGVEILLELHDERSAHQPLDELTVNVGARWEFSERYSLLLSAGRDLHNTLTAPNTLLSYLGLQVRL